MTREEVLKLEPGEALDRLVAEKVMGCSPESYERGVCFKDPFRPSRDIELAWQVVTELFSKYHQFALRLDDHGDCWAEFFQPGTRGQNEAWAETAPHAICLAALLVAEGGKS